MGSGGRLTEAAAPCCSAFERLTAHAQSIRTHERGAMGLTRLFRSSSLQGANVHSFDPDASPDEKKAQALKSASNVTPLDLSAAPSLKRAEHEAFEKAGGSSVSSDIGTKGSQIPVTTGLKDVQKVNSEEKSKEGEVSAAERAMEIAKDEGRVDEDGQELPPGNMPNKEAEKGKPRESACVPILAHTVEADR